MDINTECQVRLLSCELLNISTLYQKHKTKSSRIHIIHTILRKKTGGNFINKRTKTWSIINTALFVLILALWSKIYIEHKLDFLYGLTDSWNNYTHEECLYDDGVLRLVTQESSRPAFNCSLCFNKTDPIVLKKVDPLSFSHNYAYLGMPILIKNAFKNSSQTRAFNYEFFQTTYDSVKGSYDMQERQAQFFGYKTEFQTLEDALHMSLDRRNKSWYFGWNNVVPEVEKIFRKHFIRPSFIPTGDGVKKIDWIFMGTPGKGAPIHLDNVHYPSWQAQIRGIKTWTLQPSAECINFCPSMKVTVHPGDMIFVDTNQWYHSTEIHEGEISITIGSEYD